MACPSAQPSQHSFSHCNFFTCLPFPGKVSTVSFYLSISGSPFLIIANLHNFHYKFLPLLFFLLFILPLLFSLLLLSPPFFLIYLFLLTFISTEPPEPKVHFLTQSGGPRNFLGCHFSQNGTAFLTSPSSYGNVEAPDLSGLFSFERTL